MKNEDAPPQLAVLAKFVSTLSECVTALAGKISRQQHRYDNFI